MTEHDECMQDDYNLYMNTGELSEYFEEEVEVNTEDCE